MYKTRLSKQVEKKLKTCEYFQPGFETVIEVKCNYAEYDYSSEMTSLNYFFYQNNHHHCSLHYLQFKGSMDYFIINRDP